MRLLAQNPRFRLLLGASAISNLGDGVSALAFPWLASLLTRDPFLIALVAFAGQLPWVLFSIPAGVITDRYGRARLMVLADTLRFGFTLSVVALILTTPDLPFNGQAGGYISALCLLALCLGMAEVLRDNAAQTLLPRLVKADDLEEANGQLWSVEHIMGAFLGPPLAGVLIALAVPAPFLLDALTFAMAAYLVWRIKLPPEPARPKAPIWPQITEGWAWMRTHTTVLRLAIMLGCINAISAMALTMLILYAQEVLGLTALGHGLLLTAGAAGGVAGGLLGPMLAARLGQQRAVILAMALFPLPMLILALTSSPLVAGIALFAEALAALLWNIVTVSYRQRRIPDALLGRVNALYRFFGWGMLPLGALAGGALVSLLEPDLGREAALRAPYALGALLMAAMLGYGAAKLRL